jgi:tRNA(Ile)-lysidine synthase
MNADASFTRVRARRALADLERDLGPGVAAALARTADQLREDADLLDALADDAFSALADPLPADPAPAPAPLAPAHSRYYRRTSGGGNTSNQREVEVGALAELPRPIRTRVWRRLLIAAGAPAGQVSTRHTDACDRLLTHWHGQGPLHVPGDLRVARAAGRITIGLAHHS